MQDDTARFATGISSRRHVAAGVTCVIMPNREHVNRRRSTVSRNFNISNRMGLVLTLKLLGAFHVGAEIHDENFRILS